MPPGSDILTILEGAYYVSGIVLAIVAIIGVAQILYLKSQTATAVEQLRLLKSDFVTRNQRASKEKALDMSFRYADFLERYGEELAEATRMGLTNKYKGVAGPSFRIAELDVQFHRDNNPRIQSGIMVPSLNMLEGIAAAFVSRVADEEVVFTMMASSFCNSVALQYDIVTHYHSLPRSDFYTNIVKLYRVWNSRLEHSEMAAVATDAMERLAQTKDERLPPPLGTDLDD